MSQVKNIKEQELYQRLSKDMRKGLRKIYKDLTSATHSKLVDHDSTDRLIEEASAQLSEVAATTQKATEDIMNIVEKQMDLQAAIYNTINDIIAGKKDASELNSVQNMLNTGNDDLINVMTLLSFQDLTGQRIQKVVKALQNIENTILDLYVASGVMIKSKEEHPERDFESLEKEAQEALETFKNKQSELKGPSNEGCSQNDIDDLLSQFDM